MAAPGVQERDRALGALAGRGVDQLDAVDLEAEERLGEVRDLEADVVTGAGVLAARVAEADDQYAVAPPALAGRLRPAAKDADRG